MRPLSHALLLGGLLLSCQAPRGDTPGGVSSASLSATTSSEPVAIFMAIGGVT